MSLQQRLTHGIHYKIADFEAFIFYLKESAIIDNVLGWMGKNPLNDFRKFAYVIFCFKMITYFQTKYFEENQYSFFVINPLYKNSHFAFDSFQMKIFTKTLQIRRAQNIKCEHFDNVLLCDILPSLLKGLKIEENWRIWLLNGYLLKHNFNLKNFYSI